MCQYLPGVPAIILTSSHFVPLTVASARHVTRPVSTKLSETSCLWSNTPSEQTQSLWLTDKATLIWALLLQLCLQSFFAGGEFVICYISFLNLPVCGWWQDNTDCLSVSGFGLNNRGKQMRVKEESKKCSSSHVCLFCSQLLNGNVSWHGC